MAKNDVYVPPIMRGETQQMTEPISDTPERYAPGKPYGELVEWGETIRSYRPTALALNQAEWDKKSLFERMTMLPSENDPPRTMKDLLNREFIAGGEQLPGENQLFGLTDKNDELEMRYGEPVLDFMYAKMRPGQAEPEYVLTYRVTESFVEKIYNGQSYALTISELENFMNIVQQYRTLIRHKFYPIDDLIEDDNDERVDGSDYEEIDPKQYRPAA